FMGEFSCKVDNKGRLMLPVKFREQLGEGEFVITRGLDNCIDLFPIEEWEHRMEKLKQLKTTNSNHRAYQRFILSAATKLTLDSQGRLNLPSSLIGHAEISKNATVMGSDDHIEIWSEEKWNDYINQKSGIIEDIVDGMDF
ncbi:MAG: division/cell wall cluster transcriptional repressor MraZ, partial [Pseudoleptotrichia goodfellowii]|nr:division/cell wall cluster transcriptional repressor MraZ [Pseudoleptotrichia goodfellowii]